MMRCHLRDVTCRGRKAVSRSPDRKQILPSTAMRNEIGDVEGWLVVDMGGNTQRRDVIRVSSTSTEKGRRYVTRSQPHLWRIEEHDLAREVLRAVLWHVVCVESLSPGHHQIRTYCG